MINRRKSKRTRSYVSKNADNRYFCPAIQRQKFCYETKEKAELACKFSKNPQRVYYCESCCAYHTTRMRKKDYNESHARRRDNEFNSRIKKLSMVNTAKSKMKKIRKEQIEYEKTKLAKMEDTIQRFASCRLIQQIRNGDSVLHASKEELAEIVKLDSPEAEQAFEKTLASKIRVEKFVLELYMLNKMMIQDGLKYESIAEMVADSFIDLDGGIQRQIVRFLMELYNAGIIFIEKDSDGQRVYSLKTRISMAELTGLPEECRRYFVPRDS